VDGRTGLLMVTSCERLQRDCYASAPPAGRLVSCTAGQVADGLLQAEAKDGRSFQAVLWHCTGPSDVSDLLRAMTSELVLQPRWAVLAEGLDARSYFEATRNVTFVLPRELAKPVLGEVIAELLRVCPDCPIEEFAAEYKLSPQERRLLLASLAEKDNAEAAHLLGCSPSTIRTYWGRLLQKVGARRERDVLARLVRRASEHIRPPVGI
jgi:DNA-binding CsgD family transcriptional regulator